MVVVLLGQQLVIRQGRDDGVSLGGSKSSAETQDAAMTLSTVTTTKNPLHAYRRLPCHRYPTYQPAFRLFIFRYPSQQPLALPRV